jgi:hypothetical protein
VCAPQSAAAFRAHAEAELRYTAYVARQPFVNDMARVAGAAFKRRCVNLTQVCVNRTQVCVNFTQCAFNRRLLALVGPARAAKLPGVTHDYLEAAYDNYQFAVRKSIVDVQVRGARSRPFGPRPRTPSNSIVVAPAEGLHARREKSGRRLPLGGPSPYHRPVPNPGRPDSQSANQ